MSAKSVDPQTLLRTQREIVTAVKSLNQQLKTAQQTNQQVESILIRAMRIHPHSELWLVDDAASQVGAAELGQLLPFMNAALATAEASEQELKRRRARAYAIALVSIIFLMMMGLCAVCYFSLSNFSF